MPPTNTHENTRTIIYLGSSNHTSDTLIICDRIFAQDPTTLLHWGDDYYYRSCETDQITGASARKVILFLDLQEN